MTRPVILGNGNMLVCIDKNAQIRDFYYPHVGQENHVSGHHHRMGIWVNGKFSWVTRQNWELKIGYVKDTLVSEITANNSHLGIKIAINEAVHPHKNIFLRRVHVTNESSKKREIRVFFSQHFQISETSIGDTVYYNPIQESLINYKAKRYFLIGGMHNKLPFSDYATGTSQARGKRGTWVDAEDGKLGKNAIEHGSVDSTIGFTLNLGGNKTKIIDYWITVGQNYHEVSKLKENIIKTTPEKILEETKTHWKKWLDKKPVDFCHLDKSIQDLFRRSLLIVNAQTDKRGAIIAANDTHTFHSKKDTYSYMWPRDGALVARSLDKVGHHEITENFFKFCSTLLTDDGYLLHKYRPDGSFGSSWHSWLKGDKIQLPIQEDETALVLDALWKHYKRHKKDETIKKIYKNFIKPAGDFLVDFRDPKTNLPKETYDLWEEKLGIHTFTCATVYAGLNAAKNLAEIFGNKANAKKYLAAANEIREAIIKHLYDEESGVFLKRIYEDENRTLQKDKTIDISTGYGLFEYKVLEIEDPRLIKTMDKTIETLWSNSKCGGMIRYENDQYYKSSHEENPWFISTMWLAEYHIAKAKIIEDLKSAKEILEWATKRALPSGAMSEQLNPETGEPKSVAPLTWSHASFITAVVKYISKFEELEKEKD